MPPVDRSAVVGMPPAVPPETLSTPHPPHYYARHVQFDPTFPTPSPVTLDPAMRQDDEDEDSDSDGDNDDSSNVSPLTVPTVLGADDGCPEGGEQENQKKHSKADKGEGKGKGRDMRAAVIGASAMRYRASSAAPLGNNSAPVAVGRTSGRGDGRRRSRSRSRSQSRGRGREGPSLRAQAWSMGGKRGNGGLGGGSGNGAGAGAGAGSRRSRSRSKSAIRAGRDERRDRSRSRSLSVSRNLNPSREDLQREISERSLSLQRELQREASQCSFVEVAPPVDPAPPSSPCRGINRRSDDSIKLQQRSKDIMAGLEELDGGPPRDKDRGPSPVKGDTSIGGRGSHRASASGRRSKGSSAENRASQRSGSANALQHNGSHSSAWASAQGSDVRKSGRGSRHSSGRRHSGSTSSKDPPSLEEEQLYESASIRSPEKVQEIRPPTPADSTSPRGVADFDEHLTAPHSPGAKVIAAPTLVPDEISNDGGNGCGRAEEGTLQYSVSDVGSLGEDKWRGRGVRPDATDAGAAGRGGGSGSSCGGSTGSTSSLSESLSGRRGHLGSTTRATRASRVTRSSTLTSVFGDRNSGGSSGGGGNGAVAPPVLSAPSPSDLAQAMTSTTKTTGTSTRAAAGDPAGRTTPQPPSSRHRRLASTTSGRPAHPSTAAAAATAGGGPGGGGEEEVTRLNRLAASLLSRGRTSSALKAYSRALASAKSDMETIRSSLRNLRGGSRRGSDNAAAHAEARRLQERLVKAAGSAADVLNNMGVAREMEGNHPDALDCFRRALDIYVGTCGRKEDGSDDKVDRTLKNVVQAEMALESREEREKLKGVEEKLGERIMAWRDALESVSAASSASNSNGKGGSGIKGGGVDEDDDGLAAIKLTTLRAERLSVLRSLLRIQRDTLGPSHPSAASTLLSIGSLLLEMRDCDGAVQEMESSAEIYRNSLGCCHPEVGRALIQLGVAYVSRGAHGDEGRALEVYEEAARAFEEAAKGDEDGGNELSGEADGFEEGGPNPGLGVALNSVGLVHLGRDDTAAAMEAFVLASEAYGLSSFSDDTGSRPADPNLADVWSNIGKIRCLCGEHAEALDAYEFALEVLESARGDEARAVRDDRGKRAVRDAFRFAMGVMGDSSEKSSNKQKAKVAAGGRKGASSGSPRSGTPPKEGDAINMPTSGEASVVSELTMDIAIRTVTSVGGGRSTCTDRQRLTALDKSLREMDVKTAVVLHGMGTVQLELGLIDAAAASLDEALRLLRMHPGAPSQAVAEVLETIGDLSERTGDLSAAAEHFAEALNLRRSMTPSGERGNKDEAKVLYKLGMVQMRRRRWKDAIAGLRESARLHRANGTEEGDPTLVEIHAQLHKALKEEKTLHPSAEDRGDDRRRHLSRSDENRKAGTAQHRHHHGHHGSGRRAKDEAYALDQEAESLRRRGEYDKAFEVCTKALKIRMARENAASSSSGGGSGSSSKSEKIDIARTLRNMAYLYGKRGDVESARVLYEKALRIYRRNKVDDDHPYVEAVYRDLEKLERNYPGRACVGKAIG